MSLITRISGCLDDIRSIYKLLLFIAVLFYFIYQALTGANGYKSYLIIKQQVNTKQKELDQLKCQLNELKQKVDLLSDNALDLDILEERCRAILNYSYSSDIIIRSKSVF
ncbi:MAG: septum formation initiator family protein [Alphaproteobacteria bacterium]|nr:septum formation initiator family protein [Alphaproteobacteria bacterium]